MQLDIRTLAFLSGLIFLTESIALGVQYLVNRNLHSVRWWLAGSTTWALGVLLMPLVNVPAAQLLARLANPLVVLALICLYIGINRFFHRQEHGTRLVVLMAVFFAAYNYFIDIDNSISARTIVVAAAEGLIAFVTAGALFWGKSRHLRLSANFTALIFFIFGVFSVIRAVVVGISPQVQTYADPALLLALSFVMPIAASLLWTFGFIIMSNQRLNAENREEKEKLQLIFDMSPDAALIARLADGQIVDVNAGFIALTGHGRAELVANTAFNLHLWRDPAERQAFVREMLSHGACRQRDFVFQRKDGTTFTGRMSANVITLQGRAHAICLIQDITKSKQAEEALHESEALYRSILNASPDDITITDLQGRILVISPAARRMFGYTAGDELVLGTRLLDYLVPEERARATASIGQLLTGTPAGPREYHGIRKDGSLFDIEVNSGLIPGADGKPAKLVFMVRDIGERKQAEAHIQQLMTQLEVEKQAAQHSANTDSLTRLANRRRFDGALSTEFVRLRRSGASLSLIMLDIDHFKKFNDCYGHLAGDDVLRRIGAALRAQVGRASDMAARYGGEEFVVLLPDTDLAGAATLAERIRQAIEALAIPHAASDTGPCVTVSLGVVTADPNQSDSAEQLLALADDALYEAKAGGRNRVCLAEPLAQSPDPLPDPLLDALVV